MKLTKIKEFAIVGAGQGAPKKDSDYSETGIPFIRAGSLEKLINGVNEDKLELIQKETANKYKLKLYPSGTVIFAKSGMSATKNRIYKLRQPCYVVNHLATLQPKENVFPNYLVYALYRNKPSQLINDPAYPSISQKAIEEYKIPIPENYEDQIRIATLLCRTESLIAKRKNSIRLLDELIKSTFLEMFGDPMKNEKGWEKRAIKEHIGKVITGNTPPRNNKAFYNEKFVEWIKTDNIFENKMFITEAREYLSKLGLKEGRCINDGSLLVTCIAGSIKSIGTAALTNRMVAFNQQINAIEPFDEINSYYLYWLFRVCKKYIQGHATKGMKKIITKSEFEKIIMIKPDFNLQNKFAQIVEKVESIKSKYETSLTELENLYGSLSQRAFRGELDLSRVPIDTAVKPETVEAKLESHAPEVETTRKFTKKELIKILKQESGQPCSFNELWNSLEKSSFKDLPEYDEVKKMIFDMLEGENPLLSQSFDKEKKEIALRINV